MRDVLEKVIGFAPAYVTDLLRLVQGPKRFVAERVSEERLQLRDGLLFLAISFLLGWIVKTSFLRGDLVLELATDAGFVLFQVLAYGAALCSAWRIVKGRAELQKLFVIHFYYTGVLLLILACWFMTTMGVLRAADPQFYAEFLDATYRGNAAPYLYQDAQLQRFAHSPALVPLYLVLMVGIFVIVIWLWAGWGAYRQLNHLSKVRSAISATLFLLFWFPVSAIVFLIAYAGVK